jgi:hypothetical protein
VDGSGAELEEEGGASGGTGGADPRTISRRITGYHPSDLRIAIALGIGLTYDEVAAIAPCGRSNIAYRLEANKDFIQEWREFSAKAFERLQQREESVTQANYLKRKEKLLGMAEKLMAKALEDGLDPKKSKDFQRFNLAVKTAVDLENRLFGTPKQKIETESKETRLLDVGPGLAAILGEAEAYARKQIESGDEIVIEVIPNDPGD